MASIGMDGVDPSFERLSVLVADSVQAAFQLDATDVDTAISQRADNPAFDIGPTRIIYVKGEAILRMLANAIGNDAFIEGVRAYLRRYSYSNAETKDLWRELEVAAKKSGDFDEDFGVEDFMDGFVRQPGFPVVNVQGMSAHFKQRLTVIPICPQTTNRRRTWSGCLRPSSPWTPTPTSRTTRNGFCQSASGIPESA